MSLRLIQFAALTIDYVNNWSIDNNLKLDVKKTKDVNISTSHVPYSVATLAIGDETLTVKLLGVHLSFDLKWSTHINSVLYVQRRASVYLLFEY